MCLGLDGKEADADAVTENRHWFMRQDKLRSTVSRWLKLNFPENPCHARPEDAIRGLVSRGMKGNSWACPERLIQRENRMYDYCRLHGACLRTSRHVV